MNLNKEERKKLIKEAAEELRKGPEYDYDEERIKWLNADLSE